jgi:hypothetical protein
MKILGAGLSKTGTSSLHAALQILGFYGLHFDRDRLNEILSGQVTQPNFRCYDDVDVVTDLPSAYFYRELAAAYPDSKIILTVRDLDAWWRSVEFHINHRFPVSPSVGIRAQLAQRWQLDRWLSHGPWPTDWQVGWQNFWQESASQQFRRDLRNCVYGSAIATEFLYKKKYLEHNDRVMAEIPPDRLLVMNIPAGDGWEQLCPFLGVPIPDQLFPHAYKTEHQAYKR